MLNTTSTKRSKRRESR